MTELTLELAKQLTQDAESTDFTVDFDELWQWCGYTRKDNAKRVLEKNFDKDLDYFETFLHFEEWASQGNSKKSNAKRTLEENFEKDLDYKERLLHSEQSDNHAGLSPQEKAATTRTIKVYTTPDCGELPLLNQRL